MTPIGSFRPDENFLTAIGLKTVEDFDPEHTNNQQSDVKPFSRLAQTFNACDSVTGTNSAAVSAVAENTETEETYLN
jgi:hypothetical protein